MERKRDSESSGLLLKKGNPLNEKVTYKIGGTVYEVSTICGGSELLYDKMERLIKSETIKPPTDKKEEMHYNTDSNQFVVRSLQEERTHDYNKQLSRQHHRFICPPFARGRFGRG